MAFWEEANQHSGWYTLHLTPRQAYRLFDLVEADAHANGDSTPPWVDGMPTNAVHENVGLAMERTLNEWRSYRRTHLK